MLRVACTRRLGNSGVRAYYKTCAVERDSLRQVLTRHHGDRAGLSPERLARNNPQSLGVLVVSRCWCICLREVGMCSVSVTHWSSSWSQANEGSWSFTIRSVPRICGYNRRNSCALNGFVSRSAMLFSVLICFTMTSPSLIRSRTQASRSL